MHQIYLTSKSEKQLKKLPPQVKRNIIPKIKALSKNQYPQQFKPLKGHQVAQYRLRVGDYRVLYDINDTKQEVLILAIGHRKDIYR